MLNQPPPPPPVMDPRDRPTDPYWARAQAMNNTAALQPTNDMITQNLGSALDNFRQSAISPAGAPVNPPRVAQTARLSRTEAETIIARAAIIGAGQEVTPDAIEQVRAGLASMPTEQVVGTAIATYLAFPETQRQALASDNISQRIEQGVQAETLGQATDQITGDRRRDWYLRAQDFMRQPRVYGDINETFLQRSQRAQVAADLAAEIDPMDPNMTNVRDSILGYMQKEDQLDKEWIDLVRRYDVAGAQNLVAQRSNQIRADALAQKTMNDIATLGHNRHRLQFDMEKHFLDRQDSAFKLAWEMDVKNVELARLERQTQVSEFNAGIGALNYGLELQKYYQTEDHFRTNKVMEAQKAVQQVRKDYADLVARTSNDWGQLINTGTGHAIAIAKEAPPNTRYAPGYEPGGPYHQLAQRIGFKYNPDDWLTANFTTPAPNPYAGAQAALPGLQAALDYAMTPAQAEARYGATLSTPFDPAIPAVSSMGMSPYPTLAGMPQMQALTDLQTDAAAVYEDEDENEGYEESR